MWHPLFILLYIGLTTLFIMFHKDVIMKPEEWSEKLQKAFVRHSITESQSRMSRVTLHLLIFILIVVGVLIMAII